MSTNSAIAVKTSTGQYKTIYCHNDGYFDYTYPMLDTWYNTQERAEALVSFGDASFIAKRLSPSQGSGHSFDNPEEDVSIFYYRDRSERWVDNAPRILDRDNAINYQYYTYLFEDGQWKAYTGGKEVESYEY